MDRPKLEVADVLRRYGETYRQQHGASLSAAQRRVMSAVEACRTAVLGGHVEQCDQCGHQRICYNSCRNRHCPKCQSLARAEWIEDRQSELLDTQYFHVVFTLPEPIAAVALQNQRVVYGILFRAAAETLRTIAADPQHLGAEIGFFAVLHTWGQNLHHHPHLHCVVTGGGLSPDGSRWISCRPGFFLPVRVLSRLFRRLFLEYLQKAFEAGNLRFFYSLATLCERRAFLRYLAPTRKLEWVVYAKRPFAGPQQVLDYVGRYTHRVAISNDRLRRVEDGQVCFRWKDYRHGNQQKPMTLSAEEFLRRFLLHVLPDRFQRIRYYGLLGNRYRQQKLARCRQLLGMSAVEGLVAEPGPDYRDRYEQLTGCSLWQCPACHRVACWWWRFWLGFPGARPLPIAHEHPTRPTIGAPASLAGPSPWGRVAVPYDPWPPLPPHPLGRHYNPWRQAPCSWLAPRPPTPPAPFCLAAYSTARYNPHRLDSCRGLVQLIFSPPLAAPGHVPFLRLRAPQPAG